MKTLRRFAYALGVVILLGLIVLDILFLKTATPPSEENAFLERRLTECGAFPNGSTQTLNAASRMFINLPKDIYPDVNLGVKSYGATVGVVSNGGQYGYALGAEQRPNCWSYYFEFGGDGRVDLSSQSASSSIPDYVIHIMVTKN
jgi:hypothetical protein